MVAAVVSWMVSSLTGIGIHISDRDDEHNRKIELNGFFGRKA